MEMYVQNPTMRIHMTDSRERLYEALEDTAPVGTKSGAIDHAAEFYLRMVGDNPVQPFEGQLDELMQAASEQGSLPAEEIAYLLDTEQVPVTASTEWSVGDG